MAQDTDLQQGHLYDIAHQAQKKAIRARRRKLKRAAHDSDQGLAPDDKDNSQATARCPAGSAKQQRGTLGEEKAAQYLLDQGLQLIARNIHCRTGEIDLVATDGTLLIFIEVRWRESRDYGGAAASIDVAKQRRLIRTAHFFLPKLSARHFAGRIPPCRFDVISIDGDRLRWIKHAFDAE